MVASSRTAPITTGDRTGGAEGRAGVWRQTFLRAPCLRDGLVRLGLVVETFETAITWDRYEDFVASVHEAATAAARSAVDPAGICNPGVLTAR